MNDNMQQQLVPSGICRGCGHDYNAEIPGVDHGNIEWCRRCPDRFEKAQASGVPLWALDGQGTESK